MRAKEEVLHGWGMVTSGRSLVYRPSSAEEVGSALGDALDRGLTIAGRGAGLSYGDAALNEGGAVIELSRMRRVLSFDAGSGLVRAEAGATIEDVWKHTIASGWWPAVVPGTMKATLGGCVAMDVHGKNHGSAGAFGRYVKGVSLLTADGDVVEIGPGDDREGLRLRDVVGAQGLNGLILDVSLQLEPVTAGELDVGVQTTGSLDETMSALDECVSMAPYAVAWVDCFGPAAGRGVVHDARYIDGDDGRAGLSVRGQELPTRVAGIVPKRWAWLGLRAFMLPVGLRALNAVKYRSARLRGPGRYRQSHAAFHFLLDYVPGWKRAYGPRGLMQYQLFVPDESARDAFREVMDLQRSLGVHSYLGVLKRHHVEESAATYHVDGYSLALDFPAGAARLPELFRELDRVVAASDGRIYAAKDATSVGRLPQARHDAFSSNLVRRWEMGEAS